MLPLSEGNISMDIFMEIFYFIWQKFWNCLYIFINLVLTFMEV